MPPLTPHRRSLLSRAASLLVGLTLLAAVSATPAHAAAPLAMVRTVEAQPLAAQVRRVLDALELLGSPLPDTERTALLQALDDDDSTRSIAAVQEILDRHCLFGVNINPESRVKVAVGPAKAELVKSGWRVFLIKVHNEAGVTAELAAVSPNARALFEGGAYSSSSDKFFRKQGAANMPNPKLRDRWLELESFNKAPLNANLSGLELEYRIVQVYSRDTGKREAKFAFNVGQGTQDLGFRNEVDVLFQCLPAREVALRVADENGQPTTAAFLIRDRQGRVYPAQGKRLAPDFGFHPQIYRADGETVELPEVRYDIEFSRGPESRVQTRTVDVTAKTKRLEFKVERWIDPAKTGWWSGDHHIHAAGCAHYTKPTEGVHAPDMMRHCLGEDLKVGCNLTWGPCFDYQKQFFTGKDDRVSNYPYLLHYDIEVSGFGSHQSGHLCLLRLKEQMFPGGDSKHHWPTLCLNTLRWGKKQGAVVGPAHSGWGLEVDTAELPNFVIPPFNGIGANEYIVDVTHDVPGPTGALERAVDFISTVDTPYIWELNIWYHTLNCGYRTRISGETDFPCIYGERVGLGRSYVKLDTKLDYAAWCEGIRQGRNYVGDGRSHLIDFAAQAGNKTVKMGENGSELRLGQPGSVRLTVQAAALLNEQPNPEIRQRSYKQQPYWHIERARVADTRTVPVELIVNGVSVAKKTLVADGQTQALDFDVTLERSSWVAVRILPSSHTNPIFVTVGDKPIRASKRSADWCLKGVDRLWSQKERFIHATEMEQAKKDYEHARLAYQKILAEAEIE